MNIEAQKLELVQMLLDVKSSEVLQQVKAVLSANSSKQQKKQKYADDTQYLMSTQANRIHFLFSALGCPSKINALGIV